MKVYWSNFWSQPLRYEYKDRIQLITSRCIRSELWFVNNEKLEERIYAFLAKYQIKYGVKIYNFQLMGNHFHLMASFPFNNRSDFMRDLKSRMANTVSMFVPEFPGGSLFEGRYEGQVLVDGSAEEKYFFYTSLQAVHHGLAPQISEYPAKNFFDDAVRGIQRNYKYFAYGEYTLAKQKNPNVLREDFWREHTLIFSKLPAFEGLSDEDYIKLMYRILEHRRKEMLEESTARFMLKSELKKIKPGSLPKRTKKGKRRPLAMGETKAVKEFFELYFNKVAEFREACAQYRQGDLTIKFPSGMYRPSGMALPR